MEVNREADVEAVGRLNHSDWMVKHWILPRRPLLQLQQRRDEIVKLRTVRTTHFHRFFGN